jgi:hypothetical protein
MVEASYAPSSLHEQYLRQLSLKWSTVEMLEPNPTSSNHEPHIETHLEHERHHEQLSLRGAPKPVPPTPKNRTPYTPYSALPANMSSTMNRATGLNP